VFDSRLIGKESWEVFLLFLSPSSTASFKVSSSSSVTIDLPFDTVYPTQLKASLSKSMRIKTPDKISDACIVSCLMLWRKCVNWILFVIFGCVIFRQSPAFHRGDLGSFPCQSVPDFRTGSSSSTSSCQSSFYMWFIFIWYSIATGLIPIYCPLILSSFSFYCYVKGKIVYLHAFSTSALDGGFDSRQGLEIFIFTTASRPALGLTQPPIQ
jgi:hypothetical protein